MNHRVVKCDTAPGIRSLWFRHPQKKMVLREEVTPSEIGNMARGMKQKLEGILPQKKKWCLIHIPVCTWLHRAVGDELSPHSFDIYWNQHMKPSRLSRVTYNYKAEGSDGPDSGGPFIQSNPKLSPNHVFFCFWQVVFMQTPVRRHIEKMPKFQTMNVRVKVLLLGKKKGFQIETCFNGPMHAGGVIRACR